MSKPLVVKVGGSLFDLPDLGPRLRRWLDANAPPRVLLVPGGGATANAVRELQRTHGFDDELAHWLALRAMSLNAHVLAALLPESCAIDGPDLAELVWEQGRWPVLDAFAFGESDEAESDHLPHTWAATSDSVAARAAVLLDADLMLLKSAAPPAGDVAAWAECGYVDAWLPRLAAALTVRAVDLRPGTPGLSRPRRQRYTSPMSTTATYQYLEPHLGSSYKQLFIKGTKLPADIIYSAAYQRGEGHDRTPEEVAEDYGIPVEAVYEAIRYCESKPIEVQYDHRHTDLIIEAATGMPADSRQIPTRRSRPLTPEDYTRIERQLEAEFGIR